MRDSELVVAAGESHRRRMGDPADPEPKAESNRSRIAFSFSIVASSMSVELLPRGSFCWDRCHASMDIAWGMALSFVSSLGAREGDKGPPIFSSSLSLEEPSSSSSSYSSLLSPPLLRIPEFSSSCRA